MAFTIKLKFSLHGKTKVNLTLIEFLQHSKCSIAPNQLEVNSKVLSKEKKLCNWIREVFGQTTKTSIMIKTVCF